MLHPIALWYYVQARQNETLKWAHEEQLALHAARRKAGRRIPPWRWLSRLAGEPHPKDLTTDHEVNGVPFYFAK